jgi:hypothetical protein
MDEQCVGAADDVIMVVDDGVPRISALDCRECGLQLKLASTRLAAATTRCACRVDWTMPDCQHVAVDVADASISA